MRVKVTVGKAEAVTGSLRLALFHSGWLSDERVGTLRDALQASTANGWSSTGDGGFEMELEYRLPERVPVRWLTLADTTAYDDAADNALPLYVAAEHETAAGVETRA